MSRITKEEIEKTKCGRFLLSDENIYLSIYSLNSYVFEYNLLNTEDRILYHRLQDKFDARLINGVITRVREQIIELFDKDKYIEAKVYFKPKKLSENGELEFRPLHSTGLITQIAIVSMLHLFVYEIPEEEEGDPKLRLSNLSRLIPSDFYGNRVSVKPEYLFKPWKQQYQKYNQNSNDALMKYHTSLEYKYEVTLDLENFFPTINPIIIYRYIINHLPAYLNDEERKMMKRVLQKLLFCKLTTTFDEKTAGQYYKVTKGAGNYDNVDKIEQNEKECWAFKEKSDKFVRGIPQGLPQSYFLGNIYMISIAEIFRKKFTGVSYFYVDDSVIFNVVPDIEPHVIISSNVPEGVGNSRNFHMAWTRLDGNAPARTVDTGHRNLFHYELNRVPTVRESARIQSFPDNFVFKGSRTKQERQVGNAVPPLLGQALAEELLKIIERSKTNA